MREGWPEFVLCVLSLSSELVLKSADLDTGAVNEAAVGTAFHRVECVLAVG